jgi:hypothetical protein
LKPYSADTALTSQVYSDLLCKAEESVCPHPGEANCHRYSPHFTSVQRVTLQGGRVCLPPPGWSQLPPIQRSLRKCTASYFARRKSLSAPTRVKPTAANTALTSQVYRELLCKAEESVCPPPGWSQLPTIQRTLQVQTHDCDGLRQIFNLTSRSWILLQKLIVTQLAKRSPPFMKLEGRVSC